MFKASMIASALLLALAGARAAPQDLTVRGLITPESCTLELGNHGALDYGTLSASTVRTYEDADPFYLLPSRRISLTVSCPSATAVALAATDNRAASKPDFTAGDSLGFGLGRSGAQPVGVFRIQVVDMRLVRTPDGVPEPAVRVLVRPKGATRGAWGPGRTDADQGFIDHAMATGYGATAGARVPTAIVRMLGALEVFPFVLKSVVQGARSGIAIDGAATVDFEYL